MLRKMEEKLHVSFHNQLQKKFKNHISSKFHSHVVDITNPEEVQRWLNTAKTNLGEILGVIHVTGKLPEIGKLTELIGQDGKN